MIFQYVQILLLNSFRNFHHYNAEHSFPSNSVSDYIYILPSNDLYHVPFKIISCSFQIL